MPDPVVPNQPGAWTTLPPGTSKLPVSPTKAAIARWFCTPLVLCTRVAALENKAAGLVVAYVVAATCISAAGTLVIVSARSSENSAA